MKCTMRRGQAALEYVLALAALLVLVSVLWHFIDAGREVSHRAGELIKSDRI